MQQRQRRRRPRHGRSSTSPHCPTTPYSTGKVKHDSLSRSAASAANLPVGISRRTHDKGLKSKQPPAAEAAASQTSILSPDDLAAMRQSLRDAERRTDNVINELNKASPPPEAPCELPDLPTTMQRQRDWKVKMARTRLRAGVETTQNILLEDARRRARPSWMLQLELIKFVVDQFGYASRTKWRSTVVDLLGKILEHNHGRLGRIDREHLKRLIRDINCYHRGGMLDELERIIETSPSQQHGLEGGPASHQQEEYESAINPSLAQHNNININNNYINNNTTLSEVVLGCQGPRGKANAKKSPRNSRRSEHEMFLRDLEDRIASVKAIRPPSGPETIQTLTRLLVACSARGAWKQSMNLLELARTRDITPTARMFHLAIRSMVGATPCQLPQADKLLLEAERVGVPLNLGEHNVVISACSRHRPFAAWRRAAALFARLRSRGLVANRATYTALMQVAQRTRHQDAPAIYEVFKLAGVPEYLAYACAEHCLVTPLASSTSAGR